MFIKCRDGKDYEILPALIKHKDKIRHYTAKFQQGMAVANILFPDIEKIQLSVRNNEELPTDAMFTDEPYDAMMEILFLAFGEKVPKERIEEIVDVSMVPKILDTFYAVSGYDDKKKETMNKSVGEN